MKKTIFTILLSFVFSCFYAQEYSFSKAIKLNNKVHRFRILGRNVNHIVAERWGAKVHYLDAYNAKLKKVSTKEIKLEKDEKLKKVWIQPKQGWIIYTKATKEHTFLLAKKLDSRLNIKTKPVLLDSIVERKDLVQANLRTKYSLNERCMASYLPIFSEGGIAYFSVNVFDTKLKKIQSVKIKDRFITDGKYVNLLVLNDGSFVMIYKETDKTNAFKVFFKEKDVDIKKYSLNIDNEIFKKLKIEVDNERKELILAGFRLYKEKKRKNASDAFFSLKIDLKTGKKSQKVTEVFTKEFFKLLTNKESKNEKVTLQTFYIKKIIAKKDGGYFVFAESFYEQENIETSSIMQNPYATSTIYDRTEYKTLSYNYNDIIVYSIDSNQKLQTVNIINKKQHSFDDKGGYSSFFLVNQQDKLNVLFLDEISTDASFKNYAINKNSEIDKNYIFNVSQNNVMPVLKMSVQTAPNELLIPSFLNNSFSIIKVVFENN